MNPRTRHICVAALLAVLLIPATGSAQESVAMGNAQIRLLVEDVDRTVVRVEFPVERFPASWDEVTLRDVRWALPAFVDDLDDGIGGETLYLPPRLDLPLAVPTRGAVRLTVRDVSWWKEPSVAVDLGAGLEVPVPVVQRSVPRTGIQIPVAIEDGILSGVTLEFLHPADGLYRERVSLARDANRDRLPGFDDEESGPGAGIINQQLLAALDRGAREQIRRDLAVARSAKAQVPRLFDLTDHWVRLHLESTGIYRVTGDELAGLGVPATDVDPAKLRLYRGGGLQLEANPEVPDSLQAERVGLNEVAIQVVSGGDGEWNLDDEFRFYGVGTSAWLDRFTLEADSLEFYDHPYADQAVYWLTYEDNATASPLPGNPKRVQVLNSPANGGDPVNTGRVRLHHEKQVFDTPGLVQDNWCWDISIDSQRPETFSVRTPVPGSTTRFVIDIRGVYEQYTSYTFLATGWLNSDQVNAGAVSFNKTTQDTTVRMRVVGDSGSLVPGLNTITLRNDSNQPRRKLALDSYDIFYWTDLDLASGFGQLEFAHWGEQVPVPGTAVDLTLSVPVPGEPLFWNVDQTDNPVAYTGTVSPDGLTYTYGVVRSPDTDFYVQTTRVADLLRVEGGSLAEPTDLRGLPTDADYIVVHPTAFTFPALELTEFRSTQLTGVANPIARAIDTQDIYDNFSGGQKDPLAIRNYLRYVYEQGGGRLKFACFFGNASRDYRNYKGRIPLENLYDLVPTELRTVFPVSPLPLTRAMPYASDDGLVSFDEAPEGDLDFPDVATGRLPAVTLSEARGMVDRAIAFSADPEPGLWRNRVLFTADDVVRPSTYPNPAFGEDAHTDQSELLTNNVLPEALEVDKIYGVDYDFPPSSRVKPATRADINAALNDGTTIYYYVGHGAEDNLADEQIFQSRDIPNLTNGMKRMVFIAFSCDVGVFDSPARRSMAEQFVIRENGGAIGSICASQVSWTSNNNAISTAFFRNQYPDRHVAPDQAVATALMESKGEMIFNTDRSNSQRYNFFGEPGMSFPHPVDDLQLSASSVDTLRTGALQQAVLDATGTQIMLGAGDSYQILVQESAWDRMYKYNPSGNYKPFIKSGSHVFKGTGTSGSGDLVIPFKVPLQLRYGDRARVRLLLDTPDGEHTAVQILSAVQSATGPVTDVTGPVIDLAFEDDRYRVRAGTVLAAALTDTSGIAILGTSPGNSLLLEFDGTGFMTDVTGSFGYEPDSYTTGRIGVPLPADLDLGKHQVALFASDALGNVGSDTLSFEIVPAGTVGIETVTLFPNPTSGPCRLIFELSDPMAVQWEIYTLAGNRIRTISEDMSAGRGILEWDGLDGRGDEIANGTYLYVLRGMNSTSPGGTDEVFPDGRSITKTGKLVMMR